jgi:hypothetical protein
MRILICNNATGLRSALSKHIFSATVEAEYGSETVKGSLITLAHHGANSGNPAPCEMDEIPNINGNCNEGSGLLLIGAIGVSHVDLDTIGGIMAITGRKGYIPRRFWEVAAKIDVDGLHTLSEEILSERVWAEKKDLPTTIGETLNAYYAWSQEHKVYAPIDGSVADVTDEVSEQVTMFSDLFCYFAYPKGSGGEQRYLRHKVLIERGNKFKKELEWLKKDSFIELKNGVCLRVSDKFVNGFYDETTNIIVGYNPLKGKITISSKNEDFDCCVYAIKRWGFSAGGKKGIAGGPRDVSLSLAEATNVFLEISARHGG